MTEQQRQLDMWRVWNDKQKLQSQGTAQYNQPELGQYNWRQCSQGGGGAQQGDTRQYAASYRVDQDGDVAPTAQVTRKETGITHRVRTYAITVEEKNTAVNIVNNHENLAKRPCTCNLHRLQPQTHLA